MRRHRRRVEANSNAYKYIGTQQYQAVPQQYQVTPPQYSQTGTNYGTQYGYTGYQYGQPSYQNQQLGNIKLTTMADRGRQKTNTCYYS